MTAGLYLQDEWQLTRSPDPELRRCVTTVFDVSFDNEWQISPRANLVWKIDDATSVHIGYARYFMPPTLQYVPPSTVKEFEYTTDAPFNDRDDPPKVERDNYFDVGLSRQITPAWQITGDTFCKLAKNLLDDGQFGSAVILNNFNYSSGTVYGAELGSTYKQGPLSAYGNFSYVQTWARNIDSVENEFPNNEIGLSGNEFHPTGSPRAVHRFRRRVLYSCSRTPSSIRIFFMATVCAPALRILKNFPPIGRTMSAWSTSGICIPGHQRIEAAF